jgi:site-specific DNA-methyltransferase (adenine-specific)
MVPASSPGLCCRRRSAGSVRGIFGHVPRRACFLPVYEDETVRLYCGDYRSVLPTLWGRERVDLILADPPYGDTELAWDHRDLDWLWLSEPALRSSGSVWMFGSMRSLLAQWWRIEPFFQLAQDIVWEKQNGTGFHADRFRRVHEHVLHLYWGKWRDIYREPQTTPDVVAKCVRRKRRPVHMGRVEESVYISHDGGPRLVTSVIRARNCHGHAISPVEKPLEILLPLIRYSCPVGGFVLDPCCGSGSTLVAARMAGRRAIGIECDAEMIEKIVARLRGMTFASAVRTDPRQQELFP